MRLLSLELQGFKSFPDKTLLKFAPGVTTVVGPNGSGKSNISDAVRWVLGEISSKSLRGSKMEDVIFSGTDNRKPMAFAEVSLTLDNREENGFSRMPIDYDEVTITRRFNRSGNSEYMINRRPARLKDINALFMNTGIGRDGYSIVSQGKAAEIISQKSDERRNVFEEAAGISKYRYQKNDAEKKLAETALNCERLADILVEKKSQLDRLERDAERARKYLDIYEKKKEADVSLAVYDIRAINLLLSEIQGKYDSSRAALLTADNSINDTEAERDRVDLAKARAKELYARLSTEIEELTRTRHKQDTSAQLLQNEIEHMKARVAEFTSQLTEYNAQLDEHTERVQNAAEALQAATDRRTEAEEHRDKINENLSALREELDECDLKIEDNLTNTDLEKDKQVRLKMRKAELEGSARTSETRREDIAKELSLARESVEKCTVSMNRHKSRMDNYQTQSDQIKEREQETSQKISALQQRISDLNQELGALSSDLRDIRTRTETLRRMEELFEGYPHSVSAIMNASKAGKLTGICGPVSHIFTVSSRYALPIETALASTLQNIVCETEEDAKSAIAWLKENNAGRTTFYPITTMQVSPLNLDEKTLDSHRGYLGIASELIEYDEKYASVIKHLLGRTLVFDNLNNATAMAKSTGFRVRIVTLDGQQINAGGSFTGGSKKKDAGLLNRGAEIDRLNAEKIKAETAKNTAQQELDKATRELNTLLKASDESTTKLKLLNTLYQAEMNQYSAFEAQINTISENEAHLREQLSDMDNADAMIEREKQQLDTDYEECEKVIQKLASELEILNAEKNALNVSINKANTELNSVLIEIAGFIKDVDSAMRDLEFKNSQRTECAELIEKTKASIDNLNENIVSTSLQIEASSGKVAEMGAELERMTAERDSANQESIEYEQRLSRLNLSLQELMRSREILSNEYTKLESQNNGLLGDRDRLINYLAEEYTLTFSDAEALNYPPVTEENRQEIMRVLNEYKGKLRYIGSVDPSTIEQYQAAKEEYEAFSLNFEDMTKSREYFANIVESLEQEMRTRFVEVIGEINIAFQRAFSELFGGGHAELVLTDPDDVLHCGIDINVAPPGKIIKNLMALSGGEQAFISIALVFALLHVNPSPFCIFDEIEAALDEVNVAMFANYIKKYSNNTQFITITHRRGTMEVGDTLYGVTMAERGISRVLTLNVGEVESKLGVKL